MINNGASWIFNLMVWGAIVSLVALLYETFLARGFMASEIDGTRALIGLGVVAVVSLFWPRY